MDPIRLFVGASPNNQDWEAQAVLEYTARKYCSRPLEIVWMMLSQDKRSAFRGWQTSSWSTPFTALRWAIPDLCAYQGKAIYTDVDFLFFGDLAELWDQDVPGVFLLKKPDGKLKTCCMLFDCAHAEGHIPPAEVLRTIPDANGAMLTYFREHRELLGAFKGDWNCYEGGDYALDDPRLKAVHYSRLESQLHLPAAIARLTAEGRQHWYTGEVYPHQRPDLQVLFDQLLVAAAAAGYPPERYRVEPYGDFKKKNLVYKEHRTERVK